MPKFKKVDRQQRLDLFDIEGSLSKIRTWLDQLEEQYGPYARLVLESDGEFPALYVIYQELETEAEYEARMREVKKRKQEKLDREAKALSLYLKLKARFEPDGDFDR